MLQLDLGLLLFLVQDCIKAFLSVNLLEHELSFFSVKVFALLKMFLLHLPHGACDLLQALCVGDGDVAADLLVGI